MNWDILDRFAGHFLARMGDASVRAAALAILAGVLVLFVRRRSAAQHAVWTLVTLAMVVLPVLRPIVPAHLRWAQPAALEAITIGALPDLATNPTSTPASVRLAQTEPSALQLGWRGYVAIAYLAGAMIFAARLMLGLFLARRLLRGARSVGPELRRHFDLVADVGTDLEIEESNRVRVPVTTGLTRMRVILPAEWRGWSAEKMGAVLAHESAHVRRRDPLVALLAAANKCIFWSHPLAWWLQCRLAVLAEHAADDAGMAVSQDAQSYARIVMEFASRIEEHSSRLIWHAAAMSGPRIARRIRRVMDPRTRNCSRQLGGVACVLLASSAALLLWLTTAADFQSLARAQINRSAFADDGTHWGFLADARAVDPNPTTAAQAFAMERQLARDPEDEQTRAQLLRYYWKHKMEEQRIPLVLWLIDHHPESTLHGHETAGIFPSGHLDRPGGPEIFAEASRRWWVQVGEHPQDARVLGNAARALGERSMRDKIDLHKRAQALDPAHWTKSLAQLYSYVLVDSTEIGTTRMVLKNSLRDPQLAAQVRNELQTSNDIALIGTVALDVVERAVHEASSSDRSWDFAVLRMIATELVTHAEMLDPQNQRVPDVMGGINGRWSDLMEGVKGLPLASQKGRVHLGNKFAL